MHTVELIESASEGFQILRWTTLKHPLNIGFPHRQQYVNIEFTSIFDCVKQSLF